MKKNFFCKTLQEIFFFLKIFWKTSKKINSKYHESTPVFTNDGLTMYFTRNNYLNGKKGKDSEKGVLLKLYKATKNGEEWSAVSELPFNSNEYSCAHPALSFDEKTLYFSSNMPGTKGMSDIYKVTIPCTIFIIRPFLGPYL